MSRAASNIYKELNEIQKELMEFIRDYSSSKENNVIDLQPQTRYLLILKIEKFKAFLLTVKKYYEIKLHGIRERPLIFDPDDKLNKVYEWLRDEDEPLSDYILRSNEFQRLYISSLKEIQNS
jgi:hypothetical protein